MMALHDQVERWSTAITVVGDAAVVDAYAMMVQREADSNLDLEAIRTMTTFCSRFEKPIEKVQIEW